MFEIYISPVKFDQYWLQKLLQLRFEEKRNVIPIFLRNPGKNSTVNI